jgi:hypothetical protein
MNYVELCQHIKFKNKKEFSKTLSTCDQSQHEILRTLINAFCECCVSANLSIMSKFYKGLVEIQNSKNKSLASLKHLCSLLFHGHVLFSTGEIKGEFDVVALLHSYNHSIGALDEFRDIIVDEIVGMLDIMWDLMTKGWSQARFGVCASICRHILRFPKNMLYKKDVLCNAKLDNHDILVNFVLLFLNSFDFGEDIKTYVRICQNIFHYRCRVKDKPCRESLIYACIWALMNRQLLDDSEEEGTSSSRQLFKSPFGYLKILTYQNSELSNLVKHGDNPVNKYKVVDIESLPSYHSSEKFEIHKEMYGLYNQS